MLDRARTEVVALRAAPNRASPHRASNGPSTPIDTRACARRGEDGASGWSSVRRAQRDGGALAFALDPIAPSSSAIVATSAMRGTFVSTCSPGASNVAAMRSRAEFLLPEIATSPVSGPLGRTRTRSMPSVCSTLVGMPLPTPPMLRSTEAGGPDRQPLRRATASLLEPTATTSFTRCVKRTVRSPLMVARSPRTTASVDTEGGLTVETIEYSLAVPYFGFLFAPYAARAAQPRHRRHAVVGAAERARPAPGSTALGVLCAVAADRRLPQHASHPDDRVRRRRIRIERSRPKASYSRSCGAAWCARVDHRRDGRPPGSASSHPRPRDRRSDRLRRTARSRPRLAWLTVSQTGRPAARHGARDPGGCRGRRGDAGRLLRVVAYQSLAMRRPRARRRVSWIALPRRSRHPGWRLVYVVPLLGLLLVPGVSRKLVESRRYEAPHGNANFSGHAGRFWLLAGLRDAAEPLRPPASRPETGHPRTSAWVLGESGIAVLTLLTNTQEASGSSPAAASPTSAAVASSARSRFRGACAPFGLLRERMDAVGRVDDRSDRGSSGGACGSACTAAELFPDVVARSRPRGDHGARARRQWHGLIAAGDGGSVGSLPPGMALLAVGPRIVCMLVLSLYLEICGRQSSSRSPEDAIVLNAIDFIHFTTRAAISASLPFSSCLPPGATRA